MRGLPTLVAACLVLAPGAAEARVYTLQQLLDRVTAQYDGVTAAREDANAAGAQLSEANRLYWPTGQVTVGLTGSPLVRCTDSTGYSDPDKAVRQENCIQTSTVDFLTNKNFADLLPIHGVALQVSAQLIQPVYTFGKITAARTAAKAGKTAADSGVRAAQGDAALNVARAYWGLKWARATEATLVDGRGRLSSWVRKIEDQINHNAGNFTEVDLQRMKLAVDTMDLVILEVRKAAAIASAAVRVLAQEPDADIDREDLELADHGGHTLAFYQDSARMHRPEATMLEAATQAVHAGRQLRAAELFPDIAILGTLNYGFADAVDNPNNAFWSRANGLQLGVFLVARQPLDIAMRLARLDKARAEERSLAAKRRQALGGIALEIDKAYAEYDEARHRLDLAAHAEKVGRGWFNAVDQQMQVGTGESRDLADAARAYLEMRVKHLQAIMDTNVMLTALERASGML